jgi:hypothetical protein
MRAGKNVGAICDAVPAFSGVHNGAVKVEG